ncbi:TetR family transcriptional regulator [Halovenus sp. WSH3]|uniref:TetR family transcriptional regulator n=1 Tax=Halovenus carboxidivorans TaxID=2692199 RepID=A0A6B0SZ03_9EURY|nr:TetR/AcrR family transcriptional regulator [Halovenus carboxidivorans]MXR50645.1 TetR family transcriptional regulator [Halovenus carboxidivorans]
MSDDEIMEAVDQALREHGYAELTMQDIADESEKSKSLLHYHYDTKEDLLVAFLDDLLSDYEQRMACRDGRPPTERLVEFVARFVFTPEDSGREQFHLALLEMRSQGPFNDRIREQLERSDEILRSTAAEIITEGIDSGVFEEVDPERTAALLVATLDGARTRQITLGEANETYTRTVVEQALTQIVGPILEEGVELPDLDAVLADLDRDE